MWSGAAVEALEVIMEGEQLRLVLPVAREIEITTTGIERGKGREREKEREIASMKGSERERETGIESGNAKRKERKRETLNGTIFLSAFFLEYSCYIRVSVNSIRYPLDVIYALRYRDNDSRGGNSGSTSDRGRHWGGGGEQQQRGRGRLVVVATYGVCVCNVCVCNTSSSCIVIASAYLLVPHWMVVKPIVKLETRPAAVRIIMDADCCCFFSLLVSYIVVATTITIMPTQ
jgi:hypothetical protein